MRNGSAFILSASLCNNYNKLTCSEKKTVTLHYPLELVVLLLLNYCFYYMKDDDDERKGRTGCFWLAVAGCLHGRF